MAEFTWTAAQRAAIETTGQSVLVSAGAGSGKTAVLAARCAYLVSEARAPCNIDELLVVTFTDAAAAEMRQRIAQALRRRMAAAPQQGRIRYQLALLDSAQISTIHAFCRRLLNRYFAQADIDPQAPIMDPQDALLLQQETATVAFEQLAREEGRDGEAFLDLVAAYGGGGERALQRLILKTSDFLDSLPDPDGWIEEAQDRFQSASPADLAGFWLDQLRATLCAELTEQSRTVEKQLHRLSAGPAHLAAFVSPLSDYRDALGDWLERLRHDPPPKTIDSICTDEIARFEFPGIPTKRGRGYKDLGETEQAEFAAAQDLVSGVRDKLCKNRLIESFARFTCADWAEGLARTAPHVRTFLSILQSIRKQYQTAKANLGVIDFSDLQRVTLDLLRDEATGIAARLRNDFWHVLVDEFQDVNPIQAEILRLISHESDPARPGNLFAVGDVKQSIYRFRLAEPELFLERHHAFQKTVPQTDRGAAGRAIHLVENFRSDRKVIKAINAVFEKIMAPDLGGIAYDEHARLKYGLSDTGPAGGPALELHVLQKLSRADEAGGDDESEALDWQQIEREAYVIAERIGALVQQGRRYGEIVILQRSMKTRTALLARTLSQLDIPVFADGSGGFFESIEVLDMLALLSLLDNAQQDIPLAAVLRCPIFGEPLTDEQLAEVRIALPEAERGLPFHFAVQQYAKSGRDPALKSRLTTILGQLHHWRHRSRRRPLADVLWQIYEESGYPSRVGGLRDGKQRRANLLQLHEYARRFGDFRRQGLHRFLRFIDTLRESGEDLDAGTVSAPGGDVVRIMTIHRSKGLEFPVVFLGELGKRFNLSDARGSILVDRRLGIGMQAVDVDRRITYPTLPHRLVARAVKDQSLAEELRILYVAMTRAKEKLILVGTGNPPELSASTIEDGDPLPLLDRQGAAGMLDWVAGAIAAQSAGRVALLTDPPNEDAVFAMRHYSAGEMSQWRIEPQLPTQFTRRLQRLAQMEPLGDQSTAVQASPAVDVTCRRLTTPYAAQGLTHIPAVVAASALKHRYNTLHDAEDPAVDWSAEQNTGALSAKGRRFKSPDFLSESRSPDPASLGTWTHSLLQHLDLARPCDKTDLNRQRRELVSAGAISRDEADAIDLDAIAWFFTTPLGARLRQTSTRHLREWPFTLGIDPDRYSPEAGTGDQEDIVLVRGIIDLLFDAGEGWEILDYKTDDVSGEDLQGRADLYAGQLRIYADATEAVWGARPRRCWLAFLAARRIVEL